jgi:hypothetical protein
MNRCKTCIFWDVESRLEPGQRIGNCRRVMQFWDATEWGGEDGNTRVFTPEAENTLAFTEDGSSYYAGLLTRPSFGCIMHEPKTEKEP